VPLPLDQAPHDLLIDRIVFGNQHALPAPALLPYRVPRHRKRRRLALLAPKIATIAERSSDCRTGFVKYPATFNRRQRALSPRRPADVKRIILAWLGCGSVAKASASWNPSVPGM